MSDDQAPADLSKKPVPPDTKPATASTPASTGQWIFWSCIIVALIWWGAAGALVALQAETLALASQPAVLLICGALLILVPGLVLVLAGIIGRQSIRSRSANALIMQAVDQLLAPAQTATAEINTLADATRESTRSIDITTSDALASMKAMHEALSAERLRAESVSYAMADNARELTARLAEERKGLETLTRAMEAQADMMGQVIPQQSAAMVAAAKTAGEEVRAADEALEARLNHLKQAGSTLAVRLTDLDAVAKDAAARTDGLVQALTTIEDKLSRSDKTVELAKESSAMAVEAASSVGEALQHAVSAALDGAREANEEIDRISRKLHEDTARSITELRLAGIDAVNGQPAPPARRPQSNGVETPEHSKPQRTEPPAPTLNGSAHVHQDPAPAPPPLTSSAEPATLPLPPRTAPTATDSDLFDSTPAAPQKTAPPHIHVDPSHKQPPATGWSDIISDLDSEAHQGSLSNVDDMDRQAIAISLIDRLQTSGIALPTIFRPRDKKKIAAASRKSARARRAVTRNLTGAEVDRVYNRISRDAELNAMAQAFVDLEQDEALKALAETSGTARSASPRLAAFLLTDAALTAD